MGVTNWGGELKSEFDVLFKQLNLMIQHNELFHLRKEN